MTDEHDSPDDRPHHHGLVGDEKQSVNQINYVINTITNALVDNCIPFDINVFLGLASVLITNLEMQDRCITNIIDIVYNNLDSQLRAGVIKSEMISIRKPS